MDNSLLLWINLSWAHPWLDVFFTWISQRASFSFPLLGILLYISVRKFSKDGLKLWLMLITVIITGDLLGDVIKNLSAQPRPCYEIHELVRQPARATPGPCGNNLEGMPSNHALNFFATAVFMLIIIRNRVLGIGLVIIAILVGISRIYLAKHYPSQVLVGAFLGILLGCASAWLGIKYLSFIQRIHADQNTIRLP